MATQTNSPFLAITNRLKLRALEKKDAKRLFAYRNQPDVMLFQGWTPADPEEVAAYAEEMASRENFAVGHWYQVIVELAENQQVIGDVAFCIEKETGQQAELGIALDSEYQGYGYAQEAVKALVGFLFEELKLHRVHLSVDPANSASLKLCERVGFRQEGHLKSAVYFKGLWCDDIIMAMLKSEWQR